MMECYYGGIVHSILILLPDTVPVTLNYPVGVRGFFTHMVTICGELHYGDAGYYVGVNVAATSCSRP